MKKLSLLLTGMLALAAVFVACKDDIILDPPPSLVGDYEGIYTYQVGEGTNAEITEQVVTFSFSETRFFMDADTSSAEFNPTACFCEGRGTYAVTDRVRLESEGSSPEVPCTSCDPGLSPQGLFAVERPAGGLKLTQILIENGETITKRLTLTRVVPAP